MSFVIKDQRISDLESQLASKDVNLQQELERVSAYARTVKLLRDTVQSLRDELASASQPTLATGTQLPSASLALMSVEPKGALQPNDARFKQLKSFSSACADACFVGRKIPLHLAH